MSAAQLVAAARSFQAAKMRLSSSSSATAGRLFGTLRPVGDADLERWLAEIGPIADSTRAAAAQLGAASITTQVALAGETVVDTDVADIGPGLRGGAALTEVYARPVITVRRVLADGGTVLDALRAGRARAVQSIETDAQLAYRDGAARAMAGNLSVQGYRRVPNGGACLLCLMASTQRYHVRDLMPIHPTCHCGVATIIGSRDPGLILGPRVLGEIKRTGAADDLYWATAVGRSRTAETNIAGRLEQLRADLRAELDGDRRERLAVRLDAARDDLARQRARTAALTEERAARAAERKLAPEIHNHGELGPMLAPHGQAFAGPGDIAA